jgi:5-methylthioadenosine/S-adenosylhomocysteine deaminase
MDYIDTQDTCLIKSGNIGIKDGIIDFIEPSDVRRVDFIPEKIISGKHRLAIPGLVNAHTHCAMTLLRNYADDLALEDWLFNKIFPAEAKLNGEDVYWGTMLGIAEMIKAGTTSFADMYIYMDHVAEAVKNSGIRANLTIGPLILNAGEMGRTVEDTERCRKYFKTWNNSSAGRLKVYLEVHSAYMFTEEYLKNAVALAKELNTGIHTHILETQNELETSVEKYGMNSAEEFDKCGVFDVPVIAAHCVHLNDKDIEIMKQKNVNVVHNPTSNLKLGSGIAKIPEMLKRGINVALGTDGAASNNNLNMFEEMNLAALIHKGVNMDPLSINATRAIKMATCNGAQAIGFGDVTGQIKIGMKADISIIDTDKLHFTPSNNMVSSIVYSCQGSDVDTVIVDGQILMEARELKTIDEELVKFKVNECKIGQ